MDTGHPGGGAAPFPARLPFTTGAIDRDAGRRAGSVSLTAALAAETTRIVLCTDGGVVVGLDGQDRPVRLADGSREDVDRATDIVHLGRAAGRDVIGCYVPAPGAELDDPGYPVRDPRELVHSLPAEDLSLAVEATGLLTWHRVTRHCPRCGALLEPIDSGWSRRCPDDRSLHFPRTDPAVIMAIRDPEDRLLLAHNVGFSQQRMYSVLAGFVEPGESIEHAVAREAAEETGVQVVAVEYLGSQPWPFPASLMLGFRAWTGEAAPSGDLVLQDDEIASARWFTRQQLRAAVDAGELTLPSPASISWALIDDWLSGPAGARDGLDEETPTAPPRAPQA